VFLGDIYLYLYSSSIKKKQIDLAFYQVDPTVSSNSFFTVSSTQLPLSALGLGNTLRAPRPKFQSSKTFLSWSNHHFWVVVNHHQWDSDSADSGYSHKSLWTWKTYNGKHIFIFKSSYGYMFSDQRVYNGIYKSYLNGHIPPGQTPHCHGINGIHSSTSRPAPVEAAQCWMSGPPQWSSSIGGEKSHPTSNRSKIWRISTLWFHLNYQWCGISRFGEFPTLSSHIKY